MADEDIESGGQTDDSDAGDTGDDADAGSSDEGGERQAARSDEADRPSRKERRANRMREATEAREAAQREAAELRARVERAEAAAADAQRRIEERERSSQNNDRAAQTKEKVANLRRQAKTALGLSGQAAAAGNQAMADKYWEDFERLTDEANDVRFDMRDEEKWGKRKGELAGQIPDQDLMEEKQYIKAKYPWVTTNVEGRSLADGRFAVLVASGRPPTRQTMEEALTYAAKTLRLGGSSAPSEASRQRYVGFGQRDGEQDSGGSGGTMTAADVKNDLALKRMALATYNTLDPEQAYAKFAKEIGTKALRE